MILIFMGGVKEDVLSEEWKVKSEKWKMKNDSVEKVWYPAVENGCTDFCLEHDFFDLTYAILSQLKHNFASSDPSTPWKGY